MLPHLHSPFDELEGRRVEFLQALGARSLEQLQYSPGGASWSLLQIAEHLKPVEEGLVARWLVPHADQERLQRRLRHLIVEGFDWNTR